MFKASVAMVANAPAGHHQAQDVQAYFESFGMIIHVSACLQKV
jgi:hypothetical protein